MNWTKQFPWQLEILLGMALMKQNLKSGGDGPALLVLRYHLYGCYILLKSEDIFSNVYSLIGALPAFSCYCK